MLSGIDPKLLESFFVGSCVLGVLAIVLLGIMTRSYYKLSASMGKIAESKRLSTILTIEGKKDLGIKPEDFEPKKEELRKIALEKIEAEKHPDPSTWAYCVLEHSGIKLFLDNQVALNAQNALGRLRANNNMRAAKSFVTKLINNL